MATPYESVLELSDLGLIPVELGPERGMCKGGMTVAGVFHQFAHVYMLTRTEFRKRRERAQQNWHQVLAQLDRQIHFPLHPLRFGAVAAP
jgi:hypothetical protein